WEELRDVSHADRKGAARDSHAERCDQKLGVSVGERGEESRDRGEDHDEREDASPAELVRPDAQKDARERSGQDRRPDKEPELGLAEAELVLDLKSDDREDRPHREARGERNRTPPKSPVSAWMRLFSGRARHYPPLRLPLPEMPREPMRSGSY